jgi:hypothetical protein
MPMPAYHVCCYGVGCTKEAIYKIAAQWSDGLIKELKTYYLSCADCQHVLFEEARVKKNRCRLTVGETLDDPEIFPLERGRLDSELKALAE